MAIHHMSRFTELHDLTSIDIEKQTQKTEIKLSPLLSSSEQTPFIHLYRAEINRVTIFKQRLDSIVTWTITSCLFILSMIFQNIVPFNTGIMLSSLTLLLFQLVDVRRYINYDEINNRCRLMESGMYACMLDPERGDVEWKNKLLNSWLIPRKLSFYKAFIKRFRNIFIYLYVFHIIILINIRYS